MALKWRKILVLALFLTEINLSISVEEITSDNFVAVQFQPRFKRQSYQYNKKNSVDSNIASIFGTNPDLGPTDSASFVNPLSSGNTDLAAGLGQGGLNQGNVDPGINGQEEIGPGGLDQGNVGPGGNGQGGIGPGGLGQGNVDPGVNGQGGIGPGGLGQGNVDPGVNGQGGIGPGGLGQGNVGLGNKGQESIVQMPGSGAIGDNRGYESPKGYVDFKSETYKGNPIKEVPGIILDPYQSYEKKVSEYDNSKNYYDALHKEHHEDPHDFYYDPHHVSPYDFGHDYHHTDPYHYHHVDPHDYHHPY